MARRGLTALLLLLLTSCSVDACRSKATKTETTATPEPPVTAPPVTFDDVPQLIHDKSQLTLPPIFPAISKLPASVRSVERYSTTDSTSAYPPIIRADEAASEFCGSLLFDRGSWKPSRFYSAEWFADALLDEQLAARFECGAKAAVATGFQWYVVRFDEASRAGRVSFLPRDARIAPRFYETPAAKPAGLEQVSCDQLDGDGCAAYAHAIAVIPRLDVLAVGNFSSLKLLADEPGEKWVAADPARLPAITAEETASADVKVTTFDDGDLGALESAFAHDDEEDGDTRLEIQQALLRAEAVAITAVPAFSEGTGVFAISTRGHADGVAKALRKLQQAAARKPPPATGDIEDQYWAADDATDRRGFSEGTIETAGNEVRLRFKWAYGAKEIELRRQADAARATRLAPLVAVLTARVAAAEPSTADLDGFSAGFARTFTERAARKRRVVPTMMHDALPGLKLPSFQRQGDSTEGYPMVSYEPATPEKIDDLVDTLRSDGWVLRTKSIGSFGPSFNATKRDRLLLFRVIKSSDQELRVSIREH